MGYTTKFSELSQLCLSSENRVRIDDKMEMIQMPFNSENHWQRILDEVKQDTDDSNTLGMPDSVFFENNHFSYPVFLPHGNKIYRKAIILLHGLNERSWDKYYPWAYRLAKETGRPVILFPIAFHMNRAPKNWIDPKIMVPLANERRKNFNTHTLTYANAALSIRLTEDPLRFLKSGHQTAEDLLLLVKQIEEGLLPIFEKDTQIDFFAYSIGVFIAQILFIAFPKTIFANKKLFLFSGGAFFHDMNGVSRLIMDQLAYEQVHAYYQTGINYDMEEQLLLSSLLKEFPLGKAFYSMLHEENNRAFREEALLNIMGQIKGLTLMKDSVIPASGTKKLFGVISNENHNIQTLDFPYEYCHENPFPISHKIDSIQVDRCFNEVFSQASEFLGN
jgi:hypothetical protein